MIPTLEKLRQDFHIRVNDVRRIDALIMTVQFEKQWEEANDDEKLVIVNKIEWLNKDELLKYLRYFKKRPLGERNITELRTLAKRNQIPNFMLMRKATLLSELCQLKELIDD